MKKIILTVVIILFVIVAGVASYVKLGLPNVGDPEDIHIQVRRKK